MVARNNRYLPVYHVEITVLQHPIAPSDREQLWPTSWLATSNMNSQAEELKEAINAFDVLLYCSLSPLHASSLYAAGSLWLLRLRLRLLFLSI